MDDKRKTGVRPLVEFGEYLAKYNSKLFIVLCTSGFPIQLSDKLNTSGKTSKKRKPPGKEACTDGQNKSAKHF